MSVLKVFEQVIVPDSIEPIVGYRGFQVDPSDIYGWRRSQEGVYQHWRRENLRLRSVTYGWHTFEPHAVHTAVCGDDTQKPCSCLYRDGLTFPPHQPGLCGFYAIKEPNYSYLNGQCSNLGRVIFGEVEIWGKVIEHQLGYRAEHLRITKLLQPSHLFPINGLFEFLQNLYDKEESDDSDW